MSSRTYLSIGDVLALLRQEFPDVTISKIRFLESQGLVNPERTPSGYRKFYEHDVERLRWVLRQQREHFLPLKVIKGRLEQEVADYGDDNGHDGGGAPGAPERHEPVLVGSRRATGPRRPRARAARAASPGSRVVARHRAARARRRPGRTGELGTPRRGGSRRVGDRRRGHPARPRTEGPRGSPRPAARRRRRSSAPWPGGPEHVRRRARGEDAPRPGRASARPGPTKVPGGAGHAFDRGACRRGRAGPRPTARSISAATSSSAARCRGRSHDRRRAGRGQRPRRGRGGGARVLRAAVRTHGGRCRRTTTRTRSSWHAWRPGWRATAWRRGTSACTSTRPSARPGSSSRSCCRCSNSATPRPVSARTSHRPELTQLGQGLREVLLRTTLRDQLGG